MASLWARGLRLGWLPAVRSSPASSTCHLLQRPLPRSRVNVSFFSSLADMNNSVATSSVVQIAKDNLIAFHEWSHLPWFAEIAIVTIAARCLIAFPLTVNQRILLNKYEAIQPEILAISKSLQKKFKEEAYLLGRSKQRTQLLYRKALTAEINRLIVRDNCHPIKTSMVPLFQIPVWIILSNCYRNLAKLYPDPSDPSSLAAFAQLQHEGLLWFSDLTVPDPTGILPVATALVNLTIIQLHVNERRRNKLQDSFFIKLVTNGGRLFSLVIVPIGLVMPADMAYYWLISSLIGLLQNILLMNPKFKKLLQIDKPAAVANGQIKI